MATTLTPYSTVLVVAVLGLAFTLARRLRTPSLPYPPGPPPHPLWGNYRDAHCSKPWYRFTDWRRDYGDLVHFSVFGQHNIIINSPEVADQLLTKRSAIYSDRPQIPMVKLMGWDLNIGLIPYGEKWRAHRRVFQQAFNARIIESYRPIQLEELHAFLNDLLDNPDDIRNHVHRMTASVFMKVVYGHEIPREGPDRLMDATELSIKCLADGIVPGSWVVNTLPFLQYLPEWFPGCRGFNDLARTSRRAVDIMGRESYNRAKEQCRDKVCLVTILEDSRSSPDAGSQLDDDVYIGVCGTAYAAGAETTKTVLHVFFLMMCAHPEMQQKAYEEITRVTGSHRLPTFEDRASLPYVEAMLREVMRWMPVTPLAAPHFTTKEDVYRGLYIPKGCTMIANVWAMCNDELKYPEPRRFQPERFLTPEGTINDDDTILAFGFGRRICVGRHFASATVWLAMVTLLSAFEITMPDRKEDGLTDGEVEGMFSEGIAVHARPFTCSASPRSKEVVRMLRDLNN